MMECILDFTDGSYVGKVSVYKTEKQFIDSIKYEYGVDTECIEAAQIKRRYVRFYPKAPWPLSDEFDGGCYAFCEYGRGAFECFVLEA